jgi:hypothetical protein
MKQSGQKRCTILKVDALHNCGNHLFRACSRKVIAQTFWTSWYFGSFVPIANPKPNLSYTKMISTKSSTNGESLMQFQDTFYIVVGSRRNYWVISKHIQSDSSVKSATILILDLLYYYYPWQFMWKKDKI